MQNLQPTTYNLQPNHRGFTLIEAAISIAIFLILSISFYNITLSVVDKVRFSREKSTIALLAGQYMEIARNLPYSQVGTVNGNPPGNLPDLPNATNVTIEGVAYQVYYVVNYIDDPSDGTIIAATDTAPNDYKQVKLYIKDTSTGVASNFLTNIVPQGLEGLSSGGALYIKVFNAVGQPIPGAAVQIINTQLNPDINLTRTTDASGNWVEVGLPDSVSGYHIIATKSGYSTDRTYPSSGGNPDPTKPDATISNGQVTQVSFSIDKVSNLVFNTFNQTCGPLAGTGLEVRGSKLIGTPDVLKFNNTYTSDSNGQIALNNIEWDNYTPLLTGSSYIVYGSSPIQQTNILPDTSQTFTLILGPSTSNSFLAIVKDAATENPIEGATVELEKASPASNTSKITGGSLWSQIDWSGGPGQANMSDQTKYFEDDGNVSANGIPSGLRLANFGGSYPSMGMLTSSAFDTGTNATTYTTITWQPTSQDASTSVAFQIAANNDNTTWNYIGPDGTGSTYYTTPGNTISAVNNSKRYVRYKTFLSTSDDQKTPVLTSVNINYVSGCFTPGQAMFPGLSAGSDYSLTVSMGGYQPQTINNLNINGYNVLQVLLTQ